VDDFATKLEALIDEHAREMVPEHRGEMPIVADYVLVVALDDVASVEQGGTYMASKPNTPIYRTVGILNEGLRMLHAAQHD
jgi:hypothetical protein